jgi:hypothetical protein
LLTSINKTAVDEKSYIYNYYLRLSEARIKTQSGFIADYKNENVELSNCLSLMLS